MPPDQWSGAYCFCPVCLSVCLSVVNFNLHYNFWTVRDRDFIFGVHTPLITPFQMTPIKVKIKVNDLVTFDLEAKNSFLDFVAAGAYCSVSQTHLDFFSTALTYA